MRARIASHHFLPVAFAHPAILAAVLFGACFCLATRLQQPHEALQAHRSAPDDLMAGFLGEGRKLFANHFYLKADVYFHSGFYPTIFDNRESHQTPHLAEDAGVTESENTGDESSFLGPPSDWIDAHGRKHFPARHTHLGEDAPGELEAGNEREFSLGSSSLQRSTRTKSRPTRSRPIGCAASGMIRKRRGSCGMA